MPFPCNKIPSFVNFWKKESRGGYLTRAYLKEVRRARGQSRWFRKRQRVKTIKQQSSWGSLNILNFQYVNIYPDKISYRELNLITVTERGQKQLPKEFPDYEISIIAI
jgi:hypothetical protein